MAESVTDEFHSYHECYDASPFAFCIVDVLHIEKEKPADLKFVYLNDAFAAIQGRPYSEILNNNFYQIFSNADEKWLTFYGEVVKKGIAADFTEYSPEIGKYLFIQCYRIKEGRCGILLSIVNDAGMMIHIKGRVSRRQEKEAENQIKLFKVLKQYVEQKNSKDLTVRSLCTAAGVSTGSFYNMYDSLSDFEILFLFSDFSEYYHRYMSRKNAAIGTNSLEKIISILSGFAGYCRLKGRDFINSFYSSDAFFAIAFTENKKYTNRKNILLNKEILFKDIALCIEDAKKEGLIDPKFDTKTVGMILYLFFNGILVNWCISNFDFNVEEYVKESLESFFKNNYVTQFYPMVKKFT